MMANEMRAWVGCMACYNSGALVGQWYDAADAGDVTLADLHDGKPCPNHGEELWCYDTEGLGGGELSPSEVAERADILSHADDADALLAYWRSVGGDLADADDTFADAYCGEWQDGEDFAQDLAEQLGAVDSHTQWPMSCIDWAAAWRELEMGDYFTERCETGGVYVFRSI